MEYFAAFLFFPLITAVGYVLLCVLVGRLASKRGRSSLGWFLIEFFLSPILGALCRPALLRGILPGADGYELVAMINVGYHATGSKPSSIHAERKPLEE